MATPAEGVTSKRPRLCLARIRCVQECIKCLKNTTPFPEPICYVPLEVRCRIPNDSSNGNGNVNDNAGDGNDTHLTATLTIYTEPGKPNERKQVGQLTVAANQIVYVSGEELYTADGKWARLLRLGDDDDDSRVLPPGWVQLSSSGLVLLQAERSEKRRLSRKELVFGCSAPPINRWPAVLDSAYCPRLGAPPSAPTGPPDEAAVARLRTPPPNWSLDHDEDLAAFLCAYISLNDDPAAALGNIRQYVDAIDVSSDSVDEATVENLTDGDPDTCWESDGEMGNHWIRLKMKKKTVIKQLCVTVSSYDDNYMPTRLLVFGGEMDGMRKLREVCVNVCLQGAIKVKLLEEQKDFHSIIEIRIKRCKDNGIDVRVHGITIHSKNEKETTIGRDLFTADNLVRFPKLDPYEPDVLYRRSIVLQRFMMTLDKVLAYISPAWECSVGSFDSLETIRQLLPLSKRRIALIDAFLKESELRRPASMPKLYINRRSAADHRADPAAAGPNTAGPAAAGPDYQKSIFSQIYEGLQPRNSSDKSINYRWSSRYSQWWECKFLYEGIIDQGGGFRDSLSDLAEELCPTASDGPVPLPFFCRAPNQTNVGANADRDVYVPRSSCHEYNKYEWIGKLMGACLRGKENLVLSLSAFVWKRLTRQRVTWAGDYVTVDAAEVRLLETMESLDAEAFAAHFGADTTWTAVLSDGSTCPLGDGSTRPLDGGDGGDGGDGDRTVTYAERHAYALCLQRARMSECDSQIDAIRRGLLSVIPEAVLRLLTWQELERRVCGDPEISLESLSKCIHYEDLDDDDTRRKNLTDILEKFSNEDRSRFLRFITGRRRLPAIVYVYPAMGVVVNALPESCTCANILYLPKYSNVQIAAEKLRYAIYNCIAIDTDVSPWDE